MLIVVALVALVLGFIIGTMVGIGMANRKADEEINDLKCLVKDTVVLYVEANAAYVLASSQLYKLGYLVTWANGKLELVSAQVQPTGNGRLP